jgi:hypothetical protein
LRAGDFEADGLTTAALSRISTGGGIWSAVTRPSASCMKKSCAEKAALPVAGRARR